MTTTQEILHELFRRAKEDGLDAVLELWHPEGTLRDVTLGREFRGKAAITEYLTEYFAALSDLTYEPERIMTTGDSGVVVWQGATTVSKPFFGFPPSDKLIPITGVDIFDIRDGLVYRESSWYGDGWLAARMSDDAPLVYGLMPPA
jgi:steroid delta-isomerase-like uncharacterized protein